MDVITCNKFLVQAVIYRAYISRLRYDVSVRLSVRLSVTEVHLRIRSIGLANFGLNSDPTLPRITAAVLLAARPPWCSPCCLQAHHLAPYAIASARYDRLRDVDSVGCQT